MSADGAMFAPTHDQIIKALTTALGAKSDFYGDMIAPTLIGWMSLYVVICGYKAMAGKLDSPLPDVVWNLGVASILLAFVTNANGWFDAVEAAINGVNTAFGISENGIWGQLDSLWGDTQRLAETLYSRDMSNYVAVKGFAAAIIVWAGTGFVVFSAALVNLAAEFTLTLLLTTGPLFIACLAWGWFRTMFENWLKAIMSCLLTVLFTSLAVSVILGIMKGRLQEAIASQDNNILTIAFMVFGVGFMGFVTIMLAVKLAASLSGSSVAAAASTMAGAGAVIAGSVAGKALAPVAKEAGKGIAKGGGKLAGYAGNAALGAAEKGFNRYKMQQALRKSSINSMQRLNVDNGARLENKK